MLLESLEGRAMMASDVGHDHDDWSAQIHTYIPNAEYKTSVGGFLSAPTQGNKVTAAINYLKANAADFGAASSDFNHYRVTNNYVSQHNGVTHVYLQQTYNGLPIKNAVAAVSLTSSGQVISAASSFIPGLNHPAFPGPITHAFEANTALATFAQTSGYAAEGAVTTYDVNSNVRERYTTLHVGSTNPMQVRAEMLYVPKAGGGVELAWHLSHLYTFDGEHAYEVSVSLDENSPNYNKVILVGDWVAHASYNVIPMPAESPDESPQQLVVNPQDPIASPFGWHDLNGIFGNDTTNTTGNNVFAQDDVDGNNTGGVRPDGGAGLIFNFPFNPAGAPNTYLNAAIVNLFYVNNVMHDVFYHYGFDEAAGNFQEFNYTSDGLEGDAVRADAQDGSGTNNATMATPPDGTPPRMSQFIFDVTNPNRDSSMENGIIIHEYTHGISNRLTGGPADAFALQALQSRGMGEGWSDFVALWLTQVPSEIASTPRPMGAYVLGDPPTGPGIRTYPYSYDMSVNPHTLDDFNDIQQFHYAGEIWASALWDMNWLLINKYGYSDDKYYGTAGNNIAMQLVIDGMKLQPANPSFLEARDAILAADLANNGGANFFEIWSAFARRGFGFSASDGGDADSPVVVAAFDLPPQITGVVYADANLNGNRDANDIGIAGITVYADLNNNAAFDPGEFSTTSAADGVYTLNLGAGYSRVTVRQSIDPTKFVQTEPTAGAGYSINVAGGGVFSGYDFGNKVQPGEIVGRKWHDIDGDGIQDAGEPGMAGVYIYVDYNDNGKIGILEPAGVTDQFGNFRIPNVTPGIWNVREVMAPGSTATFPVGDPLNGIPGGVHFGVEVRSGETTPLIDFGNVTAIDWGDAPASYGTLAANNGAHHLILAGFGLGPAGLVVEHDPNGQPSDGADADVLDDGVRPLTAFTPGELARIAVRATTSGRAAGFLQGWIDFNHNGVFDANEKIVSDVRLAGSAVETEIEFRVPADAQLGASYARFRYGYETGSQVSPVGPAGAGEVEDYLFDFRPEDPVAVPDGPFTVKQDTNGATEPANQFNVLANDLGSTADNGVAPLFGGFVLADGTVIGPDTDAPTLNNGTVRFNSTTGLVEYTPDPGMIGNDSFRYFVVDSFGTESDPVRVDIIVAPTDPVALDDTFRVDVGSSFPVGNTASPNRFDVLTNDIPPTGIFISNIRNFDGTAANVNEIRISADGRTIEYQPPTPTFEGTRQFIYTISDNDPLTSPRSAVLTVQVSPETPSSNFYDVVLSLRVFNEAGDEGGAINVGETFTIVGYTQDIRNIPGFPAAFKGVEAAYMDVLFDYNKATVLDITVSNNYQFDRSGFNNRPGIVNEVGGAHGVTGMASPPLGGAEVSLFTITLRADAAGSLRLKADPAESDASQGDRTAVIVTDSPAPPNGDADTNPDVVPDTRVFLRTYPSADVTIGAGGEGEYTNAANSLDVNADGYITALDALIIINDLNNHGPRDLRQLWSPSSGPLPTNYIDVNLDGFTTPLDALNVINWLNANPIKPSGEGEGEGSSASANLAGAAAATSESAVAAEGEGEGDSSASLLLTPVAPKVVQSVAGNGDEEVAQPVYTSFSADIIDLLVTEDDEEIVTGSNSSSSESSEVGDELNATL